jgi:predicted phosphoribosyltransferase
MMSALFADREAAGMELAERLAEYDWPDPHLLAVPNGGVAVAAPMAAALGWPLSVVVVRKIQLPWTTEAGFGAVTSAGEVVLNEEMVRTVGLTREAVAAQVEETRAQIRVRTARFAAHGPPDDLSGSTAVLIDDGLASGVTMLAAVRSARLLRPDLVAVAVPVAHAQAMALVRKDADQLIALHIRPEYPFAVASFYEDWYDLGDTQTLALLDEAEDRIARKSA